MSHMILQTLLTIFHTRKRHKSFSTWSLHAVLSNHHWRTSISSARNHERRKEVCNVLFRSLFLIPSHHSSPYKVILAIWVSESNSLQFVVITSSLPICHSSPPSIPANHVNPSHAELVYLIELVCQVELTYRVELTCRVGFGNDESLEWIQHNLGSVQIHQLQVVEVSCYSHNTP